MGRPVTPSLKVINWYIFRLQQGQQTQAAIQWSKDNIQGEWSHRKTPSSNLHSFFIENPGDAMLFKLTWEGTS